MSSGDKHPKPHLLVPTPKVLRQLHLLLTTSDAPQLMAQWRRLDIDHDLPYLLGYNVAGTTTYADRDFIHALYDDSYAQQILGAPIRTGLDADRTLDCLVRHEHVEKVILDADNPIDFYDYRDEPGGYGAHEFATIAEHELVLHFGGHPADYERGLAKIIDFCEHKPLELVPHDLACAPYLDDPDKNEQHILKRMQALGVADAFKISKFDVEYHQPGGPDDFKGLREPRGPEHCSVCSMWMGSRGRPLTTCTLVDGLVRNTHWCDRFEPMGASNGGRASPGASGANTANPVVPVGSANPAAGRGRSGSGA